MTFRVRVIGPDAVPQVTDHDHAKREPQLAVLSAVVHGAGDLEVAVPVARAAVQAVMALDDKQRLLLVADRESPERSRPKGPGHG